MSDYEEIQAQSLIINEMSKEKYESITPEPLELYFTPDTTDQDIADAIATHNTSNTAHTDIRNAIPTNNNQLTNGAGYITGITSTDVTTALGYTPYNSSNPSGYISGITSTDVTTALGYTPYNSTNPNGYTSNIGTVTSVNNVSPVSGNVSLPVATFYWGE